MHNDLFRIGRRRGSEETAAVSSRRMDRCGHALQSFPGYHCTFPDNPAPNGEKSAAIPAAAPTLPGGTSSGLNAGFRKT